MRTIRPVTPYPGCELYYDAIKQKKRKDIADFYENKHVNSDLMTVNMTELSDSDFYNALYTANRLLLNDYINHREEEIKKTIWELYVKRNSDFRGYRHT